MEVPSTQSAEAAESGIDARILSAAFAAFSEVGYAEASTLDIATRAHVSKRDLYARYASKEAMLIACIKNRAQRMGLAPELPVPTSREMLARTLTTFATGIVREVSDPAVIATFRLAIAEARHAPEIAQALDVAGRAATRGTLTALFASAQSVGLIGSGDAADIATQYLGLLWEGLMVGMLLGVEATPGPAEAEQRAARATAAFLQLHPAIAAEG
jgi:AcrR family transcriptional regulator